MRTRPSDSGAKVPVKISPNLGLLDRSTGEFTPIIEVKGKFHFPGGFSFMGKMLRMRLYNADLPADGYRLILLLEHLANKFGIIFMPFGELAKKLGVDAPRLSRLLKMLERETLAQRVGGRQSGTILLNPIYHWCGNAKNQEVAIQIWNENRPYAKLNVVETKSA